MQHLEVVWFLLAAASAGRFPARRHQVPVVRILPEGFRVAAAGPALEHAAAMIFFAALCIALGRCGRSRSTPCCRSPVDFVPYTASHVVFYLQLLLFSGLAFFLMLSWLKRTLTITLDVDWLYRKLGPLLARRLDQSLEAGWLGIAKAAALGARGTCRRHSGASRARGHSRPHLADRQHGVVEHDHTRGISGPVVLKSGLR